MIKLKKIFDNMSLTLTDGDETSAEELWKRADCPFWVKETMRKNNLIGIEKVYYKREGGRWAFSLKKG